MHDKNYYQVTDTIKGRYPVSARQHPLPQCRLRGSMRSLVGKSYHSCMCANTHIGGGEKGRYLLPPAAPLRLISGRCLMRLLFNQMAIQSMARSRKRQSIPACGIWYPDQIQLGLFDTTDRLSLNPSLASGCGARQRRRRSMKPYQSFSPQSLRYDSINVRTWH